jgi:SET domain-containing protein
MNVYLLRSPIHGIGVFAREDIEKEDWQWVYGYPHAQMQGDPASKYGFELCDGVQFIPFAPFCFCNHSEEPNCEVTNDGTEVSIEALRDIKEGEELTIDYGYTPDPDQPF